MRITTEGDVLTIELVSRINSGNVGEVEAEIMAALDAADVSRVVFDASNLVYISSAGLRVIMKVLKRVGNVTLMEASPEVYNVFEMTGLTQMMDVRRAMRTVSVDGLPMIGAGANGKVYRLDEERIIKTYNPISNPPEKIMREKQTARQAFIAGVPSALSFDVVRVGDGYGIVYEMIDSLTLGEVIARNPDRLEEYATRMANLLKQLHATEFAPGTLPDARESLHTWVDIAERSGYYAADVIDAAHKLVDSIPPRNTFVHGDFHPGNIMVTSDDEFLLIDMGDASQGDPLIDMLASYQIMRVIADHPGGAERYMGLSSEQSIRVWDTFVRTYYGTSDPAQLEAIERRVRFYMILRSMPGVTFSEVIAQDKRKSYADFLSKVLLEGMAHRGQGMPDAAPPVDAAPRM
ncbi:MAG: phosphotransferase [Coriobacteriales bacterium]|nr:phosphotransferase [Coriobacteriales bacterium]